MSSEAKLPKNRLDFLDSVRGLAAILVILQHALEASGYLALGHGSFSETWINLGQMGVTTFFLVSGFVIPLSLEKHGDAKDFWIKRVARIYPLYWAVFLLTLFIRTVLMQQDFPNPLLSISLHALFLQNYVGAMNYVGGSWTLLIELVWYVGFCAAFFTGIAQRNSLFFGLAIFAAIAVAFLGLIAPMRLPLGRLDFIFICCAGLLFLRNFEGIVTGRSFFIFVSLLLASIAVGIFIGFYIRPEAGGEGFDFTAVIFSWSAGVALFVVFYFLRGTKIASLGLLTYLGRISYSVYLLHSPLLLLFEHFHISGFNLLALTVICTLASAHLTFKFIEQPFIRWARLSGKRSASFRGA